MSPQVIRSDSAEATAKAAAKFAKQLTPSSIVWLQGPLGAGKTCFVAGVVAGLGGDNAQVASPTYALLHEYKVAQGMIFHADLYRLKKPQEVINIGLADCYGRGPLLIEWPEMAAPFLGQPTHRVQFANVTGDNREISISGAR